MLMLSVVMLTVAYAECWDKSITLSHNAKMIVLMLSVFILSVIMLSVIMLSVFMLNIIKRVSWFKSSLLLRIQTDYITNIIS